MAQDVLVTEQIEGGRELLAQLAAEGVEVTVAFWAKETDSGLWYLFIATPMADIHGPGGAYQIIHTAIRRMPRRLLDPFEVKALRSEDGMAKAALREVTPSRFDTRPTYYNGPGLGGIGIDGAYIYPPPHPTPAA